MQVLALNTNAAIYSLFSFFIIFFPGWNFTLRQENFTLGDSDSVRDIPV